MNLNTKSLLLNKMRYFSFLWVFAFLVSRPLLDLTSLGVIWRVAVSAFILGFGFGYMLLLGWLLSVLRRENIEKERAEDQKKLLQED